MIDALLQWPFTPFAVAAACALFFYQANGGFLKEAPDKPPPDKTKLSQLTFMVFVMSLGVILSVRFLAEVGPEGAVKQGKSGTSGTKRFGGTKTFGGSFGGANIEDIRHNAYPGPAPF